MTQTVVTRCIVRDSACACLATCWASSRVGVSTRTRAPKLRLPPLPRRGNGLGAGIAAGSPRRSCRWAAAAATARRCSDGSRKAAVLPVPVGADAIRSRPASSTGMACAWTGVGWLISRRLRASRRGAARPRSAKLGPVGNRCGSDRRQYRRGPGSRQSAAAGLLDFRLRLRSIACSFGRSCDERRERMVKHRTFRNSVQHKAHRPSRPGLLQGDGGGTTMRE